MNKFNLTPIEHKIEPSVLSLFKEWTKAASTDFPDLDFTIKNELLLVMDLVDLIHKALDFLLKEKDQSYLKSWGIGYFKEFIRFSLNDCWWDEYIHKHSNEYKEITMLTAMKRYLMKEENIAAEITSLYLKNLKYDINVKEIDSEIYFSKESVTAQMMYPELIVIKQQFKSPAVICLDNIITTKLNKFSYWNNKKYLPEIGSCFTDNEIAVLLKRNTKDSLNE